MRERGGSGKKLKLTPQMEAKREREGERRSGKVKSESDKEQVWEGN